MCGNLNRLYVVKDEEERGCSRIAYHLAKSTACYMDAIVTVGSGKVREQRLLLNDSEIYAANMMLTIAVKKLSMIFQQKACVVHLLTLEEFWKDIYSDEKIRSLQIELNEKFNRWLINSENALQTVSNLFSELGEHDDAELIGELVLIYHHSVVNHSISDNGDALALPIFLTGPYNDHTCS